MKLDVFDTTGKKLTPIEVNPKDFADKVNKSLLNQALRIYISNSHQKTSKVKTRGEITGSTRKIYRQKGTGRARHGDRYAPIFVGGGVAHGPTGVRPKNLVLPKRMKRKALGSIILQKLQDKVVTGLDKVEVIDIKTAKCAALVAKIANHPKNKVLIITDKKRDKLYQASQNIQGLTMKRAHLVNTHDSASHDHIIITKNAITTLKNRVAGIKPAEVKPAVKKSTQKEASK